MFSLILSLKTYHFFIQIGVDFVQNLLFFHEEVDKNYQMEHEQYSQNDLIEDEEAFTSTACANQTNHANDDNSGS